jgi:hypothetical protein
MVVVFLVSLLVHEGNCCIFISPLKLPCLQHAHLPVPKPLDADMHAISVLVLCAGNHCVADAAHSCLMPGNKALAKELSMKGRQAAEQMWASHDQASQHIFSQRNARLTSPAAAGAVPGAPCSSMAHPVMDLHGLHVNEALVMLRQRLLQLATQQSCRSISLIVGTGHHTKGAPAAKLGPAVEQLLKELGFSYKQPQPGLLRVQL